jgi:hypothetical protein
MLRRRERDCRKVEGNGSSVHTLYSNTRRIDHRSAILFLIHIFFNSIQFNKDILCLICSIARPMMGGCNV